MPKLKLTKTLADSASAEAKDYEIRDTTVPGFLLKVTPSGRKIFMIAYRAADGQRRKPAIGRFGELTAEQARNIAQDWLAKVRRGGDPSAVRTAARQAPTVKQLCERFLSNYSIPRNKPSTVKGNRVNINAHIVPALGTLKVPEVTRVDIAKLISSMEHTPTAANLTLSCLRKMFNMAEVWGYRPDGSNPTRHIPKFPQRGRTRRITDEELRKLFAYLDCADADGLERPFVTLAIRLQFAFAARRSEIIALRWEWIDTVNRRVVWPDSKTGGMSKPLSAEAADLLTPAPRLEDSPFVIPSMASVSSVARDDAVKPEPAVQMAAGAGGGVRAVARRRAFVRADPAGDGGAAFVARGSGAGLAGRRGGEPDGRDCAAERLPAAASAGD